MGQTLLAMMLGGAASAVAPGGAKLGAGSGSAAGRPGACHYSTAGQPASRTDAANFLRDTF